MPQRPSRRARPSTPSSAWSSATRRGIAVFFRDITAQEEAEGRAIRRAAEVEAVIGAVDDGVADRNSSPRATSDDGSSGGKDLEVKPGALTALEVDGQDVRLAWLASPEKA